MRQIIALFGEAEKGAFKTPHVLKALPQMFDHLGNPPAESEGLFFAIQALLYTREVIYFRVEEEGFSKADYFSGLKILTDQEKIRTIHALCLPGVGSAEILDAFQNVCRIHDSLLITSQKDLYDYLTSSH